MRRQITTSQPQAPLLSTSATKQTSRKDVNRPPTCTSRLLCRPHATHACVVAYTYRHGLRDGFSSFTRAREPRLLRSCLPVSGARPLPVSCPPLRAFATARVPEPPPHPLRFCFYDRPMPLARALVQLCVTTWERRLALRRHAHCDCACQWRVSRLSEWPARSLMRGCAQVHYGMPHSLARRRSSRMSPCAWLTRTLNLCASYTHARNEHTQAMSVILACTLAVLVPVQFLARPAAALSSATAEQPEGAHFGEGLESLDARPRRHSESADDMGELEEQEANLKTIKAGHAAGASYHACAHLATKSSPAAHTQLVTRNTHAGAPCHTSLYHTQPLTQPLR